MIELCRSLVVSTGKSAVWVALDGETLPRMAQLRRASGRRFMPVPGDVAFVHVLEDGQIIVDHLEPRSSTLARRTLKGRAKTMAANIDTLVTVSALAQPPLRSTILDQLLAFAALEGISAIVVLTKPDLAPPENARHWRELYGELGYASLTVNPKSAEGIDALAALLSGRKSLLCGISGVGKSSIFGRLGGQATVGDLSRHGLGRQTTSAARLCRIDGGFLIDSPGIAEFGLGAIEPRELAGAFIDMREPAQRCRFGDCAHLQEPDCAVRLAVDLRRIAGSRYASYLKILRRAPEHDMVQGD